MLLAVSTEREGMVLENVDHAVPLAEAAVGRDSRDMRPLAVLACRGMTGVGELVEAVRAPQPRVSVHPGCPAWRGYVKARREGRQAFYPIADERVLDILRPGEGLLRDDAEHVEACETTKESGCGPGRAASGRPE